jgi:hypothetical protein
MKEGMLAVLLILLCFMGTSAQAETPLSNRSISVMQPGRGIGNINLGDTLETVVRKMGAKPANVKSVRTAGIVEYWMDYAELGITFILNSDMTLNRIAVSNPGINIPRTAVHVNSDIDTLVSVFGAGTSVQVNDVYDQHGYNGVRFMVNRKTRRIETIIIEQNRK